MYHPSKPFTKPPKGFLLVSNLEEIERTAPFSRVPGCCCRCAKLEERSLIGRVLFNFVCDACRTDDQDWVYRGSDYTIDDMEYQTPEVKVPNGKGGYLPGNGR